MHFIKILKKYIHHYFKAHNRKGFGIHSPFVFSLVTNVFNKKYNCSRCKDIEKERKKLLQNKNTINVIDLGTGSKKLPGPVKKISDIAKYSLKPKKQARLLASVIEYFEVKNVLELGTSLGITTSYFALSKNKPKVITLEGCPEISNIAKNTFDNLNIKNIELITGEFGNTLHETRNLLKKVDFVFFDGNHNYKSTLQYYKQCLNFKHNNTIFVFDDIHLTDDMEKAWNEIKSDNNVTVTIDMFFFGIVFFKKELYKQNFLIRQ